MNLKYNPWLSLVALLLLALILTLTCTGCNYEAEAAERNDRPAVITEETEPAPLEPEEPAHTKRFEFDYFSGWPKVENIYVITDNQTGVQYLYIQDPSGAGLCVLEPGEG